MSKLSSQKFASLTTKRQHKHAAKFLRQIFEGDTSKIPSYKEFESLLNLTPLCFSKKPTLDRIFLHEKEAQIPYSLQYKINKEDKVSNVSFLEIDIYLENLRSMHNIGAIVRSIEAFRLGTIYLSKKLPSSALEKIKKTAMGTDTLVKIEIQDDLSKLKRPFIAIETAVEATDCNKFNFPKSFTLLFGNEQYGLSDNALTLADHILHIPLFGNKNSLNVSQAVAIIANCVRNR
ncbi:MAG: tRNA (guanosine(18)-2'-O)-methyltransferase [Chlamydiia bacterium]|nr:tRNA (guanosine(18)-2'-O)-methyltransferase [Chlamydiia bacterium]